MLLRRTMLDEIGLLDEGLYTYFDDIDICWRAHQAGWETWYVPESRVIHFVGQSTGVTTLNDETEAAAGLLVRGQSTVFPEVLRGFLHGFRGCRVLDRAGLDADSLLGSASPRRVAS